MTDRHTVHEKPVSSQHPDEHQHDGEREGQELSQSETPTAAKGNPATSQKSNAVRMKEQSILLETAPPCVPVVTEDFKINE